MTKFTIGIDMWDSNYKYEGDELEHETLVTFDSYEQACEVFNKIKSEYKEEE